MTRYKTRKGIVLAEVCGEYLLVAAKAAQDFCPYVTQINETSAFLWRKLGSGLTMNQLMESVSEEYELDEPEIASKAIESFILQMLDLNYLLKEDD